MVPPQLITLLPKNVSPGWILPTSHVLLHVQKCAHIPHSSTAVTHSALSSPLPMNQTPLAASLCLQTSDSFEACRKAGFLSRVPIIKCSHHARTHTHSSGSGFMHNTYKLQLKSNTDFPPPTDLNPLYFLCHSLLHSLFLSLFPWLN